MATMTILDAIARIKGIPEKFSDLAVEYMKMEINESTHGTGELARSVRKRKYADGSYAIETHKYAKGGKYGIHEVGAIIRKGRPELYPRFAKALAFPPPYNWDGPVGKDGLVYLKHAGPVEPNDFLERTKEDLENYIKACELSDF